MKWSSMRKSLNLPSLQILSLVRIVEQLVNATGGNMKLFALSVVHHIIPVVKGCVTIGEGIRVTTTTISVILKVSKFNMQEITKMKKSGTRESRRVAKRLTARQNSREA